MATNYCFDTTACSVEAASALFCGVLGLERLRASSPTPLVGESWWAAVTLDDAEEFAQHGRRLGVSGTYTSMVFVPDKRLSWEDEVRGLIKIVSAAVDLLEQEADSSGFIRFFDEITVVEKRRCVPVVVDPYLLDKDDMDVHGAFAELFTGYRVEPLEQF